MFCPECGTEFTSALDECPDCHVPLTNHLPDPETDAASHIQTHDRGDGDLGILIRTSIWDPIAIGLARSLLEEAGIPFFTMGQNTTARQESGNIIGFWDVRIPRNRETEAREILQSIEDAK
jgi:hypothetical protein